MPHRILECILEAGERTLLPGYVRKHCHLEAFSVPKFYDGSISEDPFPLGPPELRQGSP